MNTTTKTFVIHFNIFFLSVDLLVWRCVIAEQICTALFIVYRICCGFMVLILNCARVKDNNYL